MAPTPRRQRWTCPHWRPGRPALLKGTTALVLQLAKENPVWGYRRIHGERVTMDISVGASMVRSILKATGSIPHPALGTEPVGASAIRITADTYAHVSPAADKAATQLMAAAVYD